MENNFRKTIDKFVKTHPKQYVNLEEKPRSRRETANMFDLCNKN